MNTAPSRTSFITRFLQLEAAGGILLMVSTAVAMVIANTPLAVYYDLLLQTKVAVTIGTFEIAKPLLLWINDGLMAIFFFMVGLELKRELLTGELAERKNIVLPGIGAIGGITVPALIYVLFNANDPSAMKGWAIPAATDIAFALGVLALLGTRVPVTLKIFLTSLAIFDDVGAIIIIALFYTSKISVTALGAVICCLPLLYAMNRINIVSKTSYIGVGVIMWAAMIKSGIHATLAGVILAMFIPMHDRDRPDFSPLQDLEHDLHAAVAFFILPLFAFANSGIALSGTGIDHILHGVPLGIGLGLFIGKQIGIFGFCWIAIKFKLTSLPRGVDMKSLYGAAVLCGIGFTMSLFIGSLTFEETSSGNLFDERTGIILGSLASGIMGYFILHRVLQNRQKE
ncbi:Na+/H+ antiporter NhaA [Desulforhopalus singaporensis]|uniref:Na(+)/H(+) antiporter NhaA n=1 Tax=Desulforhopalus singaporensis TaxID=91360 RepID=A0A1H0RYV8_9BACT|nr:Na+/H+ antiporter NhaA [Desulforhopalus singaporensis]SDP34575.1 sodium/proton antiporter, NhaA family [Desulforhopalus singaporensis]